MNRLPTEILKEVFNHLHLIQKLECMLVCHTWAHTLRFSCLLYTTTISKKRTFNRFLELIHSKSYQGTQVKHLILSDCFENEFNTKELFDFFPNISSIYISHRLKPRQSDNTNSVKLRSEALTSSRNQIEYIADHCNSEFTFHLLNSGLCPKLTTLVLDLMYTTKSCGHLGPLLVNAPSLFSLKILRSDITMEDFESIHAHLPKLHSLFLEMVNLVINDTPIDIHPAASVKTLSLLFHDVHVDTQIQWLWYIYKKYTQLASFEFSNFNKYFWKPSTALGITEYGFLPLVQRLGKQLKSFKTPCIPLDINMFKHFDKFDCHIHDLICNTSDEELLVRSLTHSLQQKYIQKLTLYDISSFPQELLKNLPALKSLELTYKYNRDEQYRLKCITINLNDFLRMCPITLESLHLEKALFECDASSTDRYYIKSLTLVCPLLPRDTDKFLSNCLPKLQSLALKGCIPSGANLSLPTHYLSYLDIKTRDWKSLTFISKTTLNDGKTRFYTVKGTGISVDHPESILGFFGYDGAKPVSCENGKPYIKLVCASVQTLVINNRLIC